jgi:hypothetical protein
MLDVQLESDLSLLELGGPFGLPGHIWRTVGGPHGCTKNSCRKCGFSGLARVCLASTSVCFSNSGMYVSYTQTRVHAWPVTRAGVSL